MTKFLQKEIKLSAKRRGFHLVTDEIMSEFSEISEIKKGMLQVFIQHTSAGLTINENADPTVREDFESHINKMVPEKQPYYKHTLEGADDMPAHIKASLMGTSLQIPVTNGKLNLGTWQGIYLCEHRDSGGSRKLVLSAWGE
ncbi:secondary thiamine-phosphate synthase enzyme YjbQ [Autumnicola musiva]|uniref:Secondary thiamine-phosphate synthase enzyme YjbQ n=1 Tax=Autumnicola musiva TaxID=3075589 RepID=A0ABU3DAN6_9FLAO|nr:secondary thiamine-phosphate synthase enzyme YjbQ [Zunongwangia sp. F117]MDT0678598.1 secondary thiamine-phosphate synthase enzyme YjbQ [Zunongwangia sp. F117]